MAETDTDTLERALAASAVPAHDHGGLIRWIQDGIPPGSFLTSVLCNNLREACNRADETNKHALYHIVYFLYNYAPLGCWGSEENVVAWAKAHRERREKELA